MKKLIWLGCTMMLVLCLTSILVYAQDSTQEPVDPAALPPEMLTELVPCTDGATGPCDLIATKVEDIVGVWKQYLLAPFFNAPSGMAYVRINADGTFNLADSIEHSAKPETSYASGTFTFDGQELTYGAVVGAPPPCDTPPRYQMRILKYGDKPVALRQVVISDPCIGRTVDVSQALIWVAPA